MKTINGDIYFEPGDKVVWVNCVNVAYRATVVREYQEIGENRTRVTVKYVNKRGQIVNSSPFKERVGLPVEGFDSDDYPDYP